MMDRSALGSSTRQDWGERRFRDEAMDWDAMPQRKGSTLEDWPVNDEETNYKHTKMISMVKVSIVD